MAVTTGCMATVTGVRENIVKQILFGSFKASPDAVFEPCSRIMKSVFEAFRNSTMATATDIKVVGWALHQPLVGHNLVNCLLITLMTGWTTFCKMWVSRNDSLIDNEPLVILLRQNWRRFPRSALAFAFKRRNKVDEYFHLCLIRVTGDATALSCGKG